MIKKPPLPLRKHLSQQNNYMIRPNINPVINKNVTALNAGGTKLTSELYTFDINISRAEQMMLMTEKHKKHTSNSIQIDNANKKIDNANKKIDNANKKMDNAKKKWNESYGTTTSVPKNQTHIHFS